MPQQRKIFKSLLLTAWVQILVLLCLLFRTIVLPKFLPLESYAMLQTYLLFLPYLSFFSFGFNDGFNLRFAHRKRSFFKKKDLSSSFMILVGVTLVEFLVYLFLVFGVYRNSNVVFLFIGINIPVLLIYNFFIYYLQITMRIKKYNIFVLIEKLTFVLLVLLMLITKTLTIHTVLIADVATSLLFISLAIYSTHHELMNTPFSWIKGIVGYIKNIFIGWRFMLGSYLGIVFFTYPRLIAQKNLDIRNFSYFAFAFSIVSIIYALINSVSMIIFPYLAKKDSKDKKSTYISMSDLYLLMLPFLFMSYYFCVFFVELILPEFRTSITYFVLVFLMIIINTKISMVVNNYYKALRKERIMLYDNLIAVIVMGVIMLFINDATTLFVIYTLILFGKATLATVYLQHKIRFRNFTNLVIEMIAMLFFTLSVSATSQYKWLFLFVVIVSTLLILKSKYFYYATVFKRKNK